MVEDSFTAFLVGSFVSLITIINPPATLPIFTSVTGNLDADATRRTATSASIYCFCILVGSLFAGSLIMKAFGISYGAMRVAGGMIIALLGHGMLYGKAEVSEVIMKPDNETVLTGEDAVKMQKILDALENLDDVQDVYTNAIIEE